MTSASPVIAIIDDDLDVRSALAALVVSHGYGVELYPSGMKFLAHAAKSAAGCLILDGQLLDMSGIELVLHLGKRGVEFPIVFVTGSDNERFREQAAEPTSSPTCKSPSRQSS